MRCAIMMSDALALLKKLPQQDLIELLRICHPCLRPREAAAYLGVSVRALETWRAKGIGPRPRHKGKSMRYDLAVLDAYMNVSAPPSAQAEGRPAGTGT